MYGILVKKELGLSALVTITGLYFINCTAPVFVNAWIVFLLRDPDIGNVNKTEIGRLTSQTLLAQLVG